MEAVTLATAPAGNTYQAHHRIRRDGALVRAPLHDASSRVRGPGLAADTGCIGERGSESATRPEMKTGCIAATR